MKPFLFLLLFSSTFIGCQYAAKERKLSIAEIDSINQAPFKAMQLKPMDTLRLTGPNIVGADELSIAIAFLQSHNKYESMSASALEHLIERHDQFLTYQVPFNSSQEVRLLKIELEHELRLMSFWLPRKIREKTFDELAEKYTQKGISVTAHGETIEFYGKRYEDSSKAAVDYKKILPELRRAKFTKVIYASKNGIITFTP